MSGARSPSSKRRERGPLPERDDAIAALTPEVRALIADTWERRASEELKVAVNFTVLCRKLIESGADANVLRLVADGVGEEVRHGEICHALATRYRGSEVPFPLRLTVDTSAPAVEHADMFHFLGNLAINESIASVYLEQSFADARAPSVRAVLRELLGDEVMHARAGFAYAKTALGAREARRAVDADLLRVARRAVVCWWDGSMLLLPDGVAEHGLPSLATTRICARTAVLDLVVPGFAELGIDVEPTRTWAAALDPERDEVAPAARA